MEYEPSGVPLAVAEAGPDDSGEGVPTTLLLLVPEPDALFASDDGEVDPEADDVGPGEGPESGSDTATCNRNMQLL